MESPACTIEEWIEDYAYFATASCDPELRKRGSSTLLAEYFYQKYSVSPTERAARFQEAMRFLEANFDLLNFRGAAVVGKKEALVERSLVEALYSFFGSLSSADIYKKPSIEEVRAFIESRKS